ncbi:hypothetical protein BV898_07137 [Hypsibius exemplaris]|uniref:Uncharacterized protein n=1 Tax=Hypsibius exemplaris TaxID=2072580 RepID=A0A1W0WUK4_HYPEX|nr:hypothetical protein BV898_07137 [Hypsibius exemplaris]
MLISLLTIVGVSARDEIPVCPEANHIQEVGFFSMLRRAGHYEAVVPVRTAHKFSPDDRGVERRLPDDGEKLLGAGGNEAGTTGAVSETRPETC